MKNLFRALSLFAVMGAASCQPAFATTSTVNPNVPAQGSSLSSSTLRANFLAAYNDINTIYAQLATIVVGGINSLSGDVTTAPVSGGNAVATVGHVNGVQYFASPSANTVPVVTSASNGGTVTYEAVPNAALQNSTITIAGHSVILGGTQAIAGTDLSATGTPSSSTYLRGDNTWASVAGGVTSVFGRSGAVAATSGDYTVSQVTGAAPLASPTFTGTVILPAGTVTNSMLAGSIASSKLVGTDIATVGTITAGTWNGTAINLSSYASGTLLAAQEPAHTGDVTNTAGSLAMNVTQLHGNTLTNGDWCVTNGTIINCTVTPITNNNQLTNGSAYLTGNQSITLSGDLSGTGTTAITGTLATVNSNVGSFGSATQVPTYTVNGKGLITAASNTAISIGTANLSATGTASSTTYLRGDNSWATPAGGGGGSPSGSSTDVQFNSSGSFGGDSGFTYGSGAAALGTSLMSPLIIGGGGTGSTLTLESTSGAGTTDSIVFKTGSEAQAMQINTSGIVSIGTTTATASTAFDVVGHMVLEGVTTTGATGTGKLVFSTSPTISSPTLSGTVAGANTIPLSILAQSATNTVLGNSTSGTANVTALSVGGCSSSSSALIWTTNTGFGCNTSIVASSATTATNLAGGAIGSVPYQSAAATTLFLAGNTTTTPNFYTSTGTGAAAQAPTLTSSTGSGSVVLATSPTLVTPALGTPASGVLTNATGLPVGGIVAIGSNTVVGNFGSSSATPSANSVPACATDGGHALTYTNGTGLSCTAVTGGGGGVSLSGNNTWTAGQAVTPTAGGTQTAGGTYTPNFALSNSVTLTFGAGNLTIANPTGIIAGQNYNFYITQDAVGGRTISWGTDFKWGSGTAPTLSTGVSATDVISCQAYTSSALACVEAIVNVH